MNTALGILAGLLYLVRQYYKKKEADDAQKEADKLENNPTDWFREHFSVPDEHRGNSASTSETKAGESNRGER